MILIERLGFEMKKSFGETELQVLVSPSYLITADNIGRQSRDKHLKQGHLLLSAVQVHFFKTFLILIEFYNRKIRSVVMLCLATRVAV